jgi:hypothetical protein
MVVLYLQISRFYVFIYLLKIIIRENDGFFFWTFRHIKRIFSNFSTLQISFNLCQIWHQPKTYTKTTGMGLRGPSNNAIENQFVDTDGCDLPLYVS